MLTVIWRANAWAQLRQIIEFISERDQAAADRLQTGFEICVERLPEFPFVCRPVRVIGTREAVVYPNYNLAYRVGPDTVEVVNVLHTRREYPPD